MKNIVVLRPLGVSAGSISDHSDVAYAISRATAVVVMVDDTPDAFVVGMLLWAISRQKPVIIAAAGTVPAILRMGSPEAAVAFSRCDESEAVFLASKIAEHEASGALFGSLNGTEWARRLRDCESPIEERLLLHLLDEFELCRTLLLRTQHPIETPAGAFRLDVALIGFNGDEGEPQLEGLKVAIECDGHRFHERTKEQAARDRSRDRTLTLEGWTVLRFTGSEIWRAPRACAKQVMDLVRAKGGD